MIRRSRSTIPFLPPLLLSSLQPKAMSAPPSSAIKASLLIFIRFISSGPGYSGSTSPL